MQALMLKLLENGALLQINGTDDSYYLGSSQQLLQLTEILFEYEVSFQNKFAWVSDSDLCTRRASLFRSMQTEKETIESFQRAVNPTVRGIYIIDAKSGNVAEKVFEYCVREWDFILEDETLLMGCANAIISAKQHYDCVVNCTPNIRRPEAISDEHYLQLNWLDDVNQHIEKDLKTAAESIHKWRLEGKRILVHCEEGISRSAACILAYLLQLHTFVEAERILGLKRPIAKPNLGFVRQLQKIAMIK